MKKINRKEEKNIKKGNYMMGYGVERTKGENRMIWNKIIDFYK